MHENFCTGENSTQTAARRTFWHVQAHFLPKSFQFCRVGIVLRVLRYLILNQETFFHDSNNKYQVSFRAYKFIVIDIYLPLNQIIVKDVKEL